MKKFRLFVLVMALAMICTAFAGCAAKTEEAPAVSASAAPEATTSEAVQEAVEKTLADLDHDVTIGMPVKSLSGLFYLELKKGAEKAIEEVNEKYGTNHQLIVRDDNKDLATELANVEDLINMNVDVMLLVCMDPSGSVPAFEKCMAQDDMITVIIDAPCEGSEKADAVIVSNNYEAGRLEAEMLAKKLDGKGSIVMISDSTNPNAAIREEGCTDELKNWPDIEVLEIRDIQSSVDNAMTAMTDLLNVYPDKIDGVWTFSDTPAQGAVAAIQAANLLDKIVVTGIDGSTVAKQLIQEGSQYGSAAQFPNKLGYEGVYTALNILVGNLPEEQTTYIDVAWIDATNVKDYIDAEQ